MTAYSVNSSGRSVMGIAGGLPDRNSHHTPVCLLRDSVSPWFSSSSSGLHVLRALPGERQGQRKRPQLAHQLHRDPPGMPQMKPRADFPPRPVSSRVSPGTSVFAQALRRAREGNKGNEGKRRLEPRRHGGEEGEQTGVCWEFGAGSRPECPARFFWKSSPSKRTWDFLSSSSSARSLWGLAAGLLGRQLPATLIFASLRALGRRSF